MTRQETFKVETKNYIDNLKGSGIIGDRYTGQINLRVDMSNGGIGNISVSREINNLFVTYSTLAKTIKVQERFFWEGTD